LHFKAEIIYKYLIFCNIQTNNK